MHSGFEIYQITGILKLSNHLEKTSEIYSEDITKTQKDQIGYQITDAFTEY